MLKDVQEPMTTSWSNITRSSPMPSQTRPRELRSIWRTRRSSSIFFNYNDNNCQEWIFSKKYPLKKSYLTDIASAYKASAENVDFSDQTKAAAIINGFVKEHTKGRINEIIEKSKILRKIFADWHSPNSSTFGIFSLLGMKWQQLLTENLTKGYLVISDVRNGILSFSEYETRNGIFRTSCSSFIEISSTIV